MFVHASFGLLINVFFLLLYIGAMRHTAYFAMRHTVESLGPMVLDVLAEPLGAYVLSQFRMWTHGQQEKTWADDVPESLRTTIIFDLGAGKL